MAATLAGAATFIVEVRFTADAVPAPDSDRRGLAPTAVARAGPDDPGEVTELRAGGTVALVAVALVADVFAASVAEGRTDAVPAKGLATVDDMEGLLPCPGVGATDVRRTRGSVVGVGLLEAAAGFGGAEVDVDRGDFFTTAPGVAWLVGFVSEVCD